MATQQLAEVIPITRGRRAPRPGPQPQPPEQPHRVPTGDVAESNARAHTAGRVHFGPQCPICMGGAS